jgi:hypothetical protein
MDERGSSRDFDFWLGEWDVFGPQERRAGRNSITALYGGGAIAEHWHGAGDVEGHSLNAYDPATDRWHQTWVDSTGGLLLLDGRLIDGSMVLEGVGRGRRRRGLAAAADHLGTRAGRRAPALGDLRRRRLHVADGLRRPLPAARDLTQGVDPLDTGGSVRIY